MRKNRYIEQMNDLGFDDDSNVDSMIHKVKGIACRSRAPWRCSWTIAAGVLGVVTLVAFLLAGGPSELPVTPTDAIDAPSITTNNTAQERTTSVSSTTETMSQPTTAVQNSGGVDGTNERYTFNRIRAMPKAGVTPIPPEDSFKKEISFAEYKEILGFDPLPAYLPSNLSRGYGTHDVDKKTITFLADGTLVPNSLGSWACHFEDPDSLAKLQIEINSGAIVKDYVVNGELERSEILGGAILCEAINGEDLLLTAEFSLRGYPIYISARNIAKEDFIKVLQSYHP